MKEKMAKMMAKKEKGEGLKAKLKVLQELEDMASSKMSDDLGDLEMPKEKVTVAADDKEGLMKGLEKAEELLSMMGMKEEESDEEDEEA